MKKALIGLALSILIVTALWFAFRREPKVVTDPIEVVVDSIHHKMDTTLAIIDSSVVRVNTIHKQYEKTYIIVTNQSVTDDVLFFTDYLSSDNSGFFNSNNSDSIKAN